MAALRLATFACDVTPPLGHPLCGGWIEPARAVDDPLWALGVILLGVGEPIVLCAVDWCGLRNDAHAAWRSALAKAVGTLPSRVAAQCVHQHNAPFADTRAEELLETTPSPPRSLDLKFFRRAIESAAAAARESLVHALPFTHVGTGEAKVERVASNRRVLGRDGRVAAVRYSATKDPKVRAEPEGVIDPMLKSLSFWNDGRPLARLHYYATHPMSYYGDGRVSGDFCGLARKKAQEAEPGVFQMYFTGCAGNVTAGKYNDGSHSNRAVLRDRILAAMLAAARNTQRERVDAGEWRTQPLKLPPRREPSFGAAESRRVVEDPLQTKVRRVNAAFQLAWLERLERPIEISALRLGTARIVHLPGEPFIEYQLRAQARRRDAFVCVAGYGDGGPGYIPTAHAYLEGGYEPTVALAGPESEAILTRAINKVLQPTADN